MEKFLLEIDTKRIIMSELMSTSIMYTFVIKDFSTKKTIGPYDFSSESY